MTLFDGVAYSDSFFLQGSLLQSFKEDPFLKSPSEMPYGEWFFLKKLSSKEYLLKTDFFGFYPIFYTSPTLNNAKISAFSNSFYALHSYLKIKNVKTTPNCINAGPNLGSHYTFFNQAYTNETPCTQIRRLGADEEMLFGDYGVLTRKFSFFESGDYKTLLNQSISNISDTLSYLFKCFQEQPISLFLSGGKDSRAVLSVLTNSLIPRQLVKCSTKNPYKYQESSLAILENDLRIGSYLVKKFGLSWHKDSVAPDDTNINFISFASSLNDWRFNKLGTHFGFVPASFLFKPNLSESIELRGGGGENLRGFWAESINRFNFSSEIKNTNKSINADAKRFFLALVPSDVPARSDSLESFIEHINTIPGEAFLEKIDNHYVLHRNRYHFGHFRVSCNAGRLLYFPLASPDLFKASRSIDFFKRQKGLVLFDFIDNFNPLLNEVEFQSGSWSDEIKLLRRDFEEKLVGSLEDSDYWKAMTMKKTKSHSNINKTLYDKNEAMHNRLSENLEILSSYEVTASYANMIRDRIQKRPTLLNFWLGKSESFAILLESKKNESELENEFKLLDL